MERKVLGRGLDALIPEKIDLKGKDLVYLPIEKLKPSSFQPRLEIDSQELEELSSSIKEKGVIQPIMVRKVGLEFEIVAGYRRFQAAKSLGINELPAVIKELNDQDAFVFALVENLQRKNLNPIEEAMAFKRLNEEFHLAYEEIAQMVGKNKTTISNSIRLLKLPQEMQDALRKNLLTHTQARTILGAETEEEKRRLFYKIIKEGLSVREIEQKVRKTSKRKRTVSTDPFVLEVEEKLRKTLGTKVKIYNKRNNRGKIVIEYYNLSDLERVIDKMVRNL